MRRVSRTLSLLGSQLKRTAAATLAFAVALSPLPVAARYDDDYRPPRQEFRTPNYQPKNFTVASPIDRQVQTMNVRLNYLSKPPAILSNLSTIKPLDLKPTFQPLIKFQPPFLNNPANAPKAIEIQNNQVKPVGASGIKISIMSGVQGVLKAMGRAVVNVFQKIGQGIANLAGKVFSGRKEAALAGSAAIANQFANLKQVSPGTFQTTGGQTFAMGKSWQEGSQFKVENDALKLIQGTSLELEFGGLKRADGGLLPVRMHGGPNGATPVGLDFDRMTPNTILNVTSPLNIEGFGGIQSGQMTFQGTSKTPDNPNKNIAIFKFNGANAHLDLNLSSGLSMDNPVTIKQATFVLQASLMSMNSAVLEKGDRKFLVQEQNAPVDIGKMGKSLTDLSTNVAGYEDRAKKTSTDLSHRMNAANSFLTAMAANTGQKSTAQIEISPSLNTLQSEATSLSQGTKMAQKEYAEENYTGLDTAVSGLERKAGELQPRLEAAESQAQAFKTLERSLSGMARGMVEILPNANDLTENLPASKDEMIQRAQKYFVQEKTAIATRAGDALEAINTLVDSGAINKEQGIALGKQILTARDALLSTTPNTRKAIVDTVNSGYDKAAAPIESVIENGNQAYDNLMKKVVEISPRAGVGLMVTGHFIKESYKIRLKALMGGGLVAALVVAPGTTLVGLGTGTGMDKALQWFGLNPGPATTISTVGGFAVGAAAESKAAKGVAAEVGEAFQGGLKFLRTEGKAALANIADDVAVQLESVEGKIINPLGKGAKNIGKSKNAYFDEDALVFKDKKTGISVSEPKMLEGPRRAGLPTRTFRESWIKGQLTDAEWNSLRNKAVEFKTDIVLSGSLAETDLGLASVCPKKRSRHGKTIWNSRMESEEIQIGFNRRRNGRY